MLAHTVDATKPTFNYVELTVLLNRVASIINDRPIGVKSLTEDL